MSAISPARPARGADAPPKPDSPSGGQSQTQLLQNREEIRVSKVVMKRFTRLCKNYGLAYEPFEDGRMAPKTFNLGFQRDSNATLSSHAVDSESDSSSEDELRVEGEGLGNHARWPQIKEFLDKLETQKRFKAVNEISSSLNEAAQKAESDLQELERLEQADEAGNLDLDEGLLNFRLDNTPAANALKRCITIASPFFKRTSKRLSMFKALPLMTAGEEDAEADADHSEEDDDNDQEVCGTKSEVTGKLQRLGALPRNADKDLQLVLEAQRDEIRALANRIDDGERTVKMLRLTGNYIDGNLDPTGLDSDLVSAAINAAQEQRASLFRARREEAERQLRQGRQAHNVPTDSEVQECLDECDRIADESSSASDRIARLLEVTAPVVESRPVSSRLVSKARPAAAVLELSHDAIDEGGSEVDMSHMMSTNSVNSVTPTAPVSPRQSSFNTQVRRRGAMRTNAIIPNGLAAPALEISHHDAPETHKKLKQQVAYLEEKLAEQNAQVSSNEVLMRNAEQTLKVLEETKTIFLEEIAREKPVLIEAFGILNPDEENDLSSQSETSDDEELDKLVVAGRLQRLEAEEQYLRLELSLAASADEDDDDDVPVRERAAQTSAKNDILMERPHTSNAEEDESFADIRRLAYRVEQEAKQQKKLAAEDAAEGRSASKSASHWSSPGQGSEGEADSEAPSELSSLESEEEHTVLSPEAAAQLLQSTPHHDMQELLQLRDENAKMQEKIKEVQMDIHRTRTVTGALDLKNMGETHVPLDQLEELQSKVRELQALRKRWWRERQDDQTTVRRALAGQDLQKSSSDPPNSNHASIFERIQASTTLA